MRSLLFAAALAALSAPAFAGQWTATPSQPASKSDFFADSVIWACGGSACAPQSSTDNADPMSECVGLARQIGPLSSFVGGGEPFNASRLARCNQAAPKAKS